MHRCVARVTLWPESLHSKLYYIQTAMNVSFIAGKPTMTQQDKKIKRLLRELKAEAHERELQREFTLLDEKFARWRAGSLSSGELGIIIEDFARGPLHELLELYNSNQFEMNIAYAVATGILKRDELPPELQVYLANALDYHQTLQERGELFSPAERIRQKRRRR